MISGCSPNSRSGGVSFGEETRPQTGVYNGERRLVEETGEGDGVTVEYDPANPLVERRVLEHGVEASCAIIRYSPWMSYMWMNKSRFLDPRANNGQRLMLLPR